MIFTKTLRVSRIHVQKSASYISSGLEKIHKDYTWMEKFGLRVADQEDEVNAGKWLG